jgi:hypothetical protein
MSDNAQNLAEELSLAFVTLKRDNGAEYVILKDGSPEWMTEVCHTAHQDGTQGGMLPDDWRHEFIKESADLLAEAEEYEWDDLQLESDVYTHDLLSWLSSRNDRVSYCDEASEEGFVNSENGTLGRISAGQWKEKDEVLSLVRTALRELAEERNG